jgi:hypothetical protein
MTQREQNSNCFCSIAAMRPQQGVMISCDTFLFAPHNLADPRSYDLASSRPRDRPSFLTMTEPAPGEALARESGSAAQGESVPNKPEQNRISANKRE